MHIHNRSRTLVCAFRTHLAFILGALMLVASPVSAAPADARLLSSQYFDEVLTSLNLDVAAAMVSPEAVIHTPEGTFHGHQGVEQFAGTLHGAFSRLQFVAQEPALEGDLATVRWTMTGIHTGTYQGLAPTCSAVNAHGIAVLRFDDIAIVEQWIEYDRMAIVNQIEMFNQISPELRPGCDAGLSSLTPGLTPIPDCGPECLRPNGNR